MTYPKKTPEQARRRLIELTYRRYPNLPKFSVGYEFDLPVHKSAFSTRGDCFGRGRIIRQAISDYRTFELSKMTDFERIALLTEGLGECASCAIGFSWRFRSPSREMSVTFANSVTR